MQPRKTMRSPRASTFCLAAFGLLGAVGALRAEEPAAPAPAVVSAPEVTARVLKKFDANGDGKLDETERAAWEAEKKAHAEKQKAAMMEKYDLDKNGQIDATEQAAMKADRDKLRAERGIKKPE